MKMFTDDRLKDYDQFITENRKKINKYLNIILACFTATGPVIALGVRTGIFEDISYGTCVGISAVVLIMSIIHYLLIKYYPDKEATSVFALAGLDLLLVFMTLNHVSIYLTWFLVPLLSLLFCDLSIFIFSSVFNYILMIAATWFYSGYVALKREDVVSGTAYFFNTAGGFTIETVIMFISGFAICRFSINYLRNLIENQMEIVNHEKNMKERLDILSSMAEIYDNVNLINFINSTEMSLRGGNLEEKGIDMSRQSHTLMNQRIRASVMPDQLDDFLKFTNITTVRKRLTNRKLITGDFIDVEKGWFRAQYITVDSTLDGIPNRVIYTTRNIDEEKRREEHLIRISLTDELTRLYNRRCYEEDMEVIRNQGLSSDLVIFSIDVNGLKKANDSLGHAAGDELIKGAADCLVSSIGSGGKAYRTGGDEFLAVVNTEDPDKLLEVIRNKTREWHGMYLEEISMSVGYAAHSDYPEEGIDGLEKIADSKMYEDKNRYYAEKGIERRVH